MKLLESDEIASVKMFKIEVTEDELDVYERCMRFLHKTLSPAEIENVCGTFEDELQSIYEQVSAFLKEYTNLR